MTLEAYAKIRKSEQARRSSRTAGCAACSWASTSTLQFEDEQTIRCQIQEMLRIEKIFEEEGIQSEIDAYAPLVPDGSNWKATMLIEYPDAHERKRELARLIGVEDRMFVEVEGHAARLRHRRRGPGPRERREDLGGALRALRVHAGARARRCAPAPRCKLGCDHTQLPGAREHRRPRRWPAWPATWPEGAASQARRGAGRRG